MHLFTPAGVSYLHFRKCYGWKTYNFRKSSSIRTCMDMFTEWAWNQTSCRILVWGGVDIIHRKTGLLAHKVTITERGNFLMSHHWIIFVWVRVPAASPSFGLMTHWTCCTSNFMGVIKKQIIFFYVIPHRKIYFFNIPYNNIYVNISM